MSTSIHIWKGVSTFHQERNALQHWMAPGIYQIQNHFPYICLYLPVCTGNGINVIKSWTNVSNQVNGVVKPLNDYMVKVSYKAKQVKFSDKVLDDCGTGKYRHSREQYGTF